MNRFWEKVDKSGECWLWTAGKFKDGYGKATPIGKSKTRYAHRISYELIVGEIPPGKELDHLCRNRSCVNPGHLEPVSHKENMLRGLGVGSDNSAKTHCIKGHEFTAENTYIRKLGRRGCRKCNAAAVAKYKLRKAA